MERDLRICSLYFNLRSRKQRKVIIAMIITGTSKMIFRYFLNSSLNLERSSPNAILADINSVHESGNAEATRARRGHR